MALGPTPPPIPNFAMAFGSLAFLGMAILGSLAGHEAETIIFRAVVGTVLAAGLGALVAFVWGGVVAVGRDLYKGGEFDALMDEEIPLAPPPSMSHSPKPSESPPAEEQGQTAAKQAQQDEALHNFAPIDYKQAAKQIQGMLKDGPGPSSEG